MSRRAPSSASNASATKRHRSITRPSEHPSHPARFKRPLTQCGPLIGQRLQPASPALRHKQSTRHRPPWPGLASEGDAWAVADPSACSRVISSTCRQVPDGFGSSAQRQHRHRRPARPPARHSPKGSIRRARRRQPGRHQPRDLASQVPPGNKANRPGRRRSATLAARRHSTARALAERCEVFALTVGAARPGASHTGGDVGRCRYGHRRAPTLRIRRRPCRSTVWAACELLPRPSRPCSTIADLWPPVARHRLRQRADVVHPGRR